MAVRISPEVRSILEAAQVTEDRVVLPPGQLDRTLYLQVSKVLEAQGGKWNQKAKAHLFPRDPRPILTEALAAGSIVKRQQELQAFYTPHDVAARMARECRITLPDMVLEPSAGFGVLAHAAAAYTHRSHIVCYDTDPEAVAALQAEGFPAACQDFLRVEPVVAFDVILMNPPFTRGQDMRHILHALRFLQPAGRLRAIASFGVSYGWSDLHKLFRTTLDEHGARFQLELLPDQTFHAAGTDVKTVMVAIG